jgi:2-dehydro-3-deoxyphosphogluconate aldolase / (4S)-4-hydroxy-2-oxoglutarate aldolase
MRSEIVTNIEAEKIMAIIRLDDQLKVAPVLERLVDAGINVLEITSNTPGFAEEILKAREKFPAAIIGAGTITNARLAQKAISCNAQFLVTPNTNVDIISIAHQSNIPVLMGAMTPSEIAEAVEHGADFIKIFPAGALGLDYFKALLGPFNNVKFFAVGDISLSNALGWFKAGVVGIGIGSSLTNGDMTDIKTSVTNLLTQLK